MFWGCSCCDPGTVLFGIHLNDPALSIRGLIEFRNETLVELQWQDTFSNLSSDAYTAVGNDKAYASFGGITRQYKLSNGTVEWSNSLGLYPAPTLDGDVFVVTGGNVKKLDPEGNLLWSVPTGFGQTSPPFATLAGHVWVSARDVIPSFGDTSLLEYDGDGTLVTTHALGYSAILQAIDLDGNFYILDQGGSIGDEMLAKLDSSADVVWAALPSTTGFSSIPSRNAVAVTPTHVYAIALGIGFDTGIYKLDVVDGATVWAQVDPDGFFPFTLDVTPDGQIFWGGHAVPPGTTFNAGTLDDTDGSHVHQAFLGTKFPTITTQGSNVRGIAVLPGKYGAGFWPGS